jgi:hypothetical protein
MSSLASTMSFLRPYLLVFLASLISADGTFTITAFPAYTSQRVCAQGCFYNYGFNLPNAIGCQSPYLDSCVCRTDLTSSGSSILSTCVNSACSSNSNDLSSAESIYLGYCATVNGGPGAAAATTTKSANDAVGQNGGSKTVTITATVVTANGIATTSSIAPITTVVSQNDPNYNNVIEIGSQNTKGVANSLQVSVL